MAVTAKQRERARLLTARLKGTLAYSGRGNYSHGVCRTLAYKTWTAMKRRCLNPKSDKYKYYGGRGITICDRWLGDNGPANFFADMGERPSVRHTLDRIDVNKGYEPSNCRWATHDQQMRNTRRTNMVVWRGKLIPLRIAADQAGVPYNTAWCRIYKMGWPVKRALTAQLPSRRPVAKKAKTKPIKMTFDLTRKRLRQVLHYNPTTGLFTWKEPTGFGCNRKAGDRAGFRGGEGYISIHVDKKTYKAHRLAWLYVYGKWPDHFIDHANGIRDDNRIINLREASASQNRINGTTRQSMSGFRGVSWSHTKQMWHARLTVNKRKCGLGYFGNKEDAARAYDRESIKIYGGFARTNFPRIQYETQCSARQAS